MIGNMPNKSVSKFTGDDVGTEKNMSQTLIQ